MNNPTLSRALAALLVLAGPPLLAGCSPSAETPPLADAKIGGPFTLTDQNGRTVRDTDFAGKYRLIYFGYTTCPDVCPLDINNIMKGIGELKKSNPQLAARIQPIFITVDPDRDTPERLRTYTDAFRGLIALTGSQQQIASVAKSFAVFYKKVPDKNIGYLVDHSRMTVLFGPKGEPLSLVAADNGSKAVVADIERWAR